MKKMKEESFQTRWNSSLSMEVYLCGLCSLDYVVNPKQLVCVCGVTIEAWKFMGDDCGTWIHVVNPK